MTGPRSTYRRSLALLLGLVAAGFVSIGLGWYVAANSLELDVQLPALVSGGIGGIGLVIAGIVLVVTQTDRRADAVQRGLCSELVQEAELVLAAAQKLPRPRRRKAALPS